MSDRSNETISGPVFLETGDTRLTAGAYQGAVVFGTAGNDTFETATTGGSYAYSFFNGGDGDDRLIIKNLDAVRPGNLFNGGAGIDTLELTTDSKISMTNDAFGTTVAYQNDLGGSVSVVNVERYVIKASAFNDDLAGSAGDDWLDGRAGVDTFQGSAGNDGYVFDSLDEQVVGEEANGGIDSIWSTVTVNLRDNANVENLRLSGTANIDGTGSDGANLITGNKFDNVITGGLGNDKLHGNGGNDTFVFAEFGSANRDVIIDFDSTDKIALNKAAFAALTGNGVLDESQFVVGPQALDANDHVIYNKVTGILSYDADGSGAGAAQEIANIGKGFSFFDHNDILLV